MQYKALAVALGAALVLAGCGGGSSSGVTNNPPPVSLAAPTQTYTASSTGLATVLNNAGSAGQLALNLATQLGVAPLNCGVSVYHYEYYSVDGQGKPVTASAALMLPTGAGATCSGARPLLEYAHGTNLDQTYDLAALNDPTNPAYSEALLVAAMYAADGYVVIAPNYVGYDTSNASYHPYLIAAAQSQDMIDALAAGKQVLSQVSTTVSSNGKFFLTGYSQGGYVALATEQAMQKAGMTVTAASPGSGPYSLAALVDYIFMGHPDLGAPQLGSLLVQAYQDAYGNVYSSQSQVFGAGDYVQLPQAHFASNGGTTLTATLPMFSSTAPTAAEVTQMPADAGTLPNTALAKVLPDTVPLYYSAPATNSLLSPDTSVIAQAVWTGFFDTSGLAAPNDEFGLGFSGLWSTYFSNGNALINQGFRANYLADALINPDGLFTSWPTGSPLPTGLATTRATDAFRQDLAANDLRGYLPTPPTMLCGGMNDPVVYYPLDTGVLATRWALANLTQQFALNVDTTTPATSGPTAAYATLQGVFEQWKNATLAIVPNGPQTEVAEYHGVVGAFCASAAQQYFAGF